MEGAVGRAAAVSALLDHVVSIVFTAVALAALIAMFIALGLEVVVRYLTNQGMGWPTELPSLLFPWLVMGGVVIAAQRGQHIAVTAVLGLLSRPVLRWWLIALQVLALCTFAYLAWVGFAVIAITGSERYPVTGASAGWAYAAMIAGFIGLAITALTTIARLLDAPDPATVRLQHVEERL